MSTLISVDDCKSGAYIEQLYYDDVRVENASCGQIRAWIFELPRELVNKFYKLVSLKNLTFFPYLNYCRVREFGKRENLMHTQSLLCSKLLNTFHCSKVIFIILALG